MIYLLLTNEYFKNKYVLYDYKSFNSRPENLIGTDNHIPLILHFTGRPEIKTKTYQKIQNKYELHPSLVPDSILSKYTVSPAKLSFLQRVKRRIK